MSILELDASEYHRITYHENNPQSDKLLICFSSQGGGMGVSGFGTELCAKNGWNHIYVGKAQQSKFRTLTLDNFVAAVSPVMDGRDVITYGSSAGGYAALYYGGIINARILSACPRNSHHPVNYRRPLIKKLGEEAIKKKAEDFYHIVHLSDVPRSAHDPVVVYDRLQPKDHRMVQKWVLPAYPECEIINIPNSGHKPLEKLKRVGGVSHLVRSFVERIPLDREKLKHKPGSLERRLDDAVELFEAGDFDRCAELLYLDLHVIRQAGLLGMYVESVSRSVDPVHKSRFVMRREEFAVLRDKIRPKVRQKIDRIFRSA